MWGCSSCRPCRVYSRPRRKRARSTLQTAKAARGSSPIRPLQPNNGQRTAVHTGLTKPGASEETARIRGIRSPPSKMMRTSTCTKRHPNTSASSCVSGSRAGAASGSDACDRPARIKRPCQSTKRGVSSNRSARETAGFRKRLRVRTSDSSNTDVADAQPTSSPLHAARVPAVGDKDADTARDKHVLWLITSAIKEAKLAQEAGSCAEARRVFEELPTQVADARRKAIFWVGWSRVEESQGNVVRAIELLSEGLAACRGLAWEHDCVMQAMTRLTYRSRWTKSPAAPRQPVASEAGDGDEAEKAETGKGDVTKMPYTVGGATKHSLRPSSPLVTSGSQSFHLNKGSAIQEDSTSDDDDRTTSDEEHASEDDEKQREEKTQQEQGKRKETHDVASGMASQQRPAAVTTTPEIQQCGQSDSFASSPLQRAADVLPETKGSESISPVMADTPPRITRVLISSASKKDAAGDQSSSSPDRHRRSPAEPPAASRSQQCPTAIRSSQVHADTIAALGDRPSSPTEEPLPEAPPVRPFVRPSPSRTKSSFTNPNHAKDSPQEEDEARSLSPPPTAAAAAWEGDKDMDDDDNRETDQGKSIQEPGEDCRGSILVLQKVQPRPSTARMLGSQVVVSPVRRSLRLCGRDGSTRQHDPSPPGSECHEAEEEDLMEERDEVKSLPFVVPSLTDSNYSYVPNAAIKRRNEPVWGLPHVGIAGTASSPPVRRRTTGLLPAAGKCVPMSAEAPRRRACLPWRKPPVSPSPYSYTRSLEAVMTRRRRVSANLQPKPQAPPDGGESAHRSEGAAVSPVARILDFIA